MEQAKKIVSARPRRPQAAKPDASVMGMVENIVGCKWSLTVLALVRSGVRRPGAMEHAVEGLSAKVLNERLKKLVRFGILDKKSYPEIPPRVEYRLTAFGRKFSGLIEQIETLEAERLRR
jgi:DNA-binding HxlR family transcriptional regulator